MKRSRVIEGARPPRVRRGEGRPQVAPPPALEALALALERAPEVLEGLTRGLFLRADWHPSLTARPELRWQAQQTSLPASRRLEEGGVAVEPDPQGRFPVVLILGTGQRDENLAMFARALAQLEEGGRLLCSLPNDWGASRFERLLGQVKALEWTFSKHHCRVFGMVKEGPLDEELLAGWAALGGYRRSPRSGWITCPGIFGWDKVDEGSRLLAEALPGSMPGVGADLGAGYGYLAARILERPRGVEALHLFEAEALALEAARRNLEGRPEARFHWHDVTAGLPGPQLDWAVMNAPFHSGRETRLEVGRRFLASAAGALKPGGCLHLVANQHLRYEPALAELFDRVEGGPVGAGFKVLRAWR